MAKEGFPMIDHLDLLVQETLDLSKNQCPPKDVFSLKWVVSKRDKNYRLELESFNNVSNKNFCFSFDFKMYFFEDNIRLLKKINGLSFSVEEENIIPSRLDDFIFKKEESLFVPLAKTKDPSSMGKPLLFLDSREDFLFLITKIFPFIKESNKNDHHELMIDNNLLSKNQKRIFHQFIANGDNLKEVVREFNIKNISRLYFLREYSLKRIFWRKLERSLCEYSGLRRGHDIRTMS